MPNSERFDLNAFRILASAIDLSPGGHINKAVFARCAETIAAMCPDAHHPLENLSDTMKSAVQAFVAEVQEGRRSPNDKHAFAIMRSLRNEVLKINQTGAKRSVLGDKLRRAHTLFTAVQPEVSLLESAE
jgi:hypothetical protein